jgi:hypothetical protein
MLLGFVDQSWITILLSWNKTGNRCTSLLFFAKTVTTWFMTATQTMFCLERYGGKLVLILLSIGLATTCLGNLSG